MEYDIALVDDHHLVRTGLVGMVNALGGFRVTLEAAHGRELIDRLNEAALPAVAIVDLNMPVMDGYATIAWLHANRPTVLPLALTFDATDDALVRAVRAGARGFILKNARPEHLKKALLSIIHTGYYYADIDQRDVHAHPERLTDHERERERVLERISLREMEFLQLVCSDEEPTYDEIAMVMGVHRRSVDNYRTNLFDKFRIKSKTGLVLFALRWGVVK
jgi:two-component system invasion response regulator UvrY